MIEVTKDGYRVTTEAARREQKYTEKLLKSRNVLLYPVAVARRRLMRDLGLWEEGEHDR